MSKMYFKEKQDALEYAKSKRGTGHKTTIVKPPKIKHTGHIPKGYSFAEATTLWRKHPNYVVHYRKK